MIDDATMSDDPAWIEQMARAKAAWRDAERKHGNIVGNIYRLQADVVLRTNDRTVLIQRIAGGEVHAASDADKIAVAIREAEASLALLQEALPAAKKTLDEAGTALAQVRARPFYQAISDARSAEAEAEAEIQNAKKRRDAATDVVTAASNRSAVANFLQLGKDWTDPRPEAGYGWTEGQAAA